MLIYIHGYGSNGLSDKARHFQKIWGETQVLAPSLSIESRLAMHTLDQLVACLQQKQTKLGLIGSSLGGYFSIYLAQKYQLPAVLINPAIPPWEKDLATLISRPGAFEWTPVHLQRLAPYRIEKPSGELQSRLLLLQQTDDEVLDANLAIDYLPLATQELSQGGGHRFSNIAEFDDQMAAFFARYSVLD